MAEDLYEDWTVFRTAVEIHQRQMEAVRAAVEVAQQRMGDDHAWMLAEFSEDMARIRQHFANSLENILYSIRAQVDAVDPVYQAEEQAYLREQQRIGEAIDRLSDPDYQGEQAEQRFYAEQDPDSQWYRADLYHGLPGPDVQAQRDAQEEAFDEAQLRRAAREPLSAGDVDLWEQDTLSRLAHDAAMERTLSPEARQARAYDAWEMSDAGIAEQEREMAHFMARHTATAPDIDPPFRPEDGFIIDTSQPDSAEDFQTLLARLDQRLEALIQGTEGQTQALTPKQGVRY